MTPEEFSSMAEVRLKFAQRQIAPERISREQAQYNEYINDKSILEDTKTTLERLNSVKETTLKDNRNISTLRLSAEYVNKFVISEFRIATLISASLKDIDSFIINFDHMLGASDLFELLRGSEYYLAGHSEFLLTESVAYAQDVLSADRDINSDINDYLELDKEFKVAAHLLSEDEERSGFVLIDEYLKGLKGESNYFGMTKHDSDFLIHGAEVVGTYYKQVYPLAKYLI